ncbi:hypothetical protein HDV00_003797 [Rhizophlyctis rosea]|nr:hypothetical protein HDV00_003797 [Rhizophlyctis rosea]
MSFSASRQQRLRELERERQLFNRSRESEGETSCFAADEAGLKGKIRVDPNGKHSFTEDLLPSVTPAWEKVGTTRGRATRESDQGATGKDRAYKRASSADAWNKLLSKEHALKAKVWDSRMDIQLVHDINRREQYYSNDKSLLVLLDEEKARYSQLEADYHKLLAEVQALQNNHHDELQTTERRIEGDRRTAESAMALKSDENASLKKQLQSWQARYSEESAAWARTNEKLEAQLAKLQQSVTDGDIKREEQEKTAQKLTRLHKELTDSFALKDSELRKVKDALRAVEADLLKEKESKMQIEVQALQLDHFVTQRDDEIKTLKSNLQKKRAEVDELLKLRGALAEVRKEMDSLVKREQKYLADIEQAARRERALVLEVEESASQQQRQKAELERLNARLALQAEDIDHVRNIELNLRQDMQENLTRAGQLADEKGHLERQLQNAEGERKELQKENADLRKLTAELRNQLHSKDLAISELRAGQDGWKEERNQLFAELSSRQQNVASLQSRLDDAIQQLNATTQQKTDLKITTQQKLASVSDRIEDLQAALQDAQNQLRTFRETEAVLQSALKQRDERIASMQTQQTELHERLTLDAHEREVGRQRKKEEILAMHDKINAAKTAMEADVTALKSQLQQKTAQLTTVSDELARVKVSVSEEAAEKFRLEARLSEVLAAESSHSRQVASLQAAIQRKEQESTLLMLKHQTSVEQLRRLEDEVAAWRGSEEKDAEVGRLQANIAEMSNRLKNQVDILIEGGTGGSKRPEAEGRVAMEGNKVAFWVKKLNEVEKRLKTKLVTDRVVAKLSEGAKANPLLISSDPDRVIVIFITEVTTGKLKNSPSFEEVLLARLTQSLTVPSPKSRRTYDTRQTGRSRETSPSARDRRLSSTYHTQPDTTLQISAGSPSLGQSRLSAIYPSTKAGSFPEAHSHKRSRPQTPPPLYSSIPRQKSPKRSDGQTPSGQHSGPSNAVPSAFEPPDAECPPALLPSFSKLDFSKQWEILRCLRYFGGPLEWTALDAAILASWVKTPLADILRWLQAKEPELEFPAIPNCLLEPPRPNSIPIYRVVIDDSYGNIQVRLRPVQMHERNRATRKFGADRYLQVEFVDKANPSVLQSMKRKARRIKLGTRVFEMLYGTEKTKARYFAVRGVGVESVSTEEWLNWHIPIGENSAMKCAKFVARLDLAFTKTTATLQIRDHTIIGDLYYPAGDATGNCLTDGCGLISEAALQAVIKGCSFNPWVCAVQGRLGSEKGMWVKDPSSVGTESVYIKSRESQKKYHIPDQYLDTSTQTTLEVCKPARATKGNLNSQFIQILEHAGVDPNVFVELYKENVQQLWDCLFSDDQAVVLKQLKVASNKDWTTQGWRRRQSEDDEDEEDAFEMDSIEKARKRSTTNFNIKVPKSARALMIPDPTGTLAPNEVYINITHLDDEYFPIGCITGDVIVGRNPAHRPSDMQRVKAVDKAELQHFRDVLVISVQAERSLASLLAGGDYDGDDALVIWDTRIVEPFVNSAFQVTDVEKYFSQNEETLGDVLKKRTDAGMGVHENEGVSDALFADFLCKKDGELGSVTRKHEEAADKWGLADEYVLQLAALCEELVDGPKSGKKLKSFPFRNCPVPDWLVGHKAALKTETDVVRSSRALGVLHRKSVRWVEEKLASNRETVVQLQTMHGCGDEDVAAQQQRWRQSLAGIPGGDLLMHHAEVKMRDIASAYRARMGASRQGGNNKITRTQRLSINKEIWKRIEGLDIGIPAADHDAEDKATKCKASLALHIVSSGSNLKMDRKDSGFSEPADGMGEYSSPSTADIKDKWWWPYDHPDLVQILCHIKATEKERRRSEKWWRTVNPVIMGQK